MGDTVTSDVGSHLRHARERRGVSLHDAARRTKLSINVLQAIERNDFARLPEGLYRRAYIRTLAAEFGLDANEVVADYRVSYELATQSRVELGRDDALADRSLQQLNSPRRSIVTLGLLAAITAAWFWLQADPVRPRARVDDHAAEPLLPRTLRYVPGGLTAQHLPDAVSSAAAADQPSDVPMRIEIAATGWCWVAAESDGERALYRLVKPGERVVLKGRRTISLRLGNAGSVTLSINDGPWRSAGDDGEVVDLTLTSDSVDALRGGPVETAGA